jgi:hypothetical protein
MTSGEKNAHTYDTLLEQIVNKKAQTGARGLCLMI